jgi:flagellar capping protein FliD
MASNLALSGLASGVDTSTIVEQLMAIDRQGTTRITYRQSGVTGMQNSLKAIAGETAAAEAEAPAEPAPAPAPVAPPVTADA